MTERYIEQPVWDAPTRAFHWINVVLVLALIAIGIGILNGTELGVSPAGKIALKTLHVYLGYAFSLNLAWRLIWTALGNRYARLDQIVPYRRDFPARLASYVAGIFGRRAPHYLGHNPLGQLAVFALFLAMTAMAVTGMVLAGTDLFMGPFGSHFAQAVANPGVDPATLSPLARETMNAAALQEMRAFRRPFGITHVYAFYTLIGLIGLHLGGVVLGELRERAGLVSAMITGRKFVAATDAGAAAAAGDD